MRGTQRRTQINGRMKITRKVAGFLLGIICCFFAGTAAAYRPFISTDAAVADTGKSEVELGADYINNREGNAVTVPSLRYNYGFAPRWESTLEGSLQVFDSASHNGVQLLASQFDIKGVLLASFNTGKFTWHLNAGGGIERSTLQPLGIWGVIVRASA
jgi:hypothetical protein